MRLPFGLGRRSGSADGASGDGATAGSAAAAAAAAAAEAGSSASSGAGASPSAPTRAWASLPAIQRTAGEMPLVAAPGTFVETLPGSHGLPPIVEPLGHEVSPLATPGLVVARVRSVEAPAAGAIPAPAPIQRRASRTSALTDMASADDAFDDAASPADGGTPTVATAPAPPAASPPAASPPAPVPVSAPIRTMPTVSRQAIRLPERPLTSAAAAAQPAPVQRAAAPGGVPAGTPLLPRPAGGMRRVPSPAPVVPQVSREVAASQPAATPVPASAEAGTPTASGPSRRGLGEPMTSAPATAKPVASVMAGPVVSRTTTSGPLPIAASSLRPVAQRSEAGVDQLPARGPGNAEPSARPATSALPQPVLRLPHLPVSRSAEEGAPAPAATAAALLPPVAKGPEMRPTTGANPLRTSVGVQRAAADDLDDGESDAELPSPWWSPAEPAPSPDTLRSTGAPAALGAPASAAIQRSTTASPGTAAASAVSPTRTTRGGAAVTTGRSAPVAAPVQRTVAQATRPSPLPQPAGAGMRFPASAVTGRSELISSVAPAAAPGGGVIGSAPVVQASPATATPPSPAPTTAAGPQAVIQREEGGAAAAATGAAGGAPSERELDELAQALFGRIRGRLRNDLIYDREAKGLTFDNV